MASANVKEFTDANFESEVLKADGPVLVDFGAEWCMPCRVLSATIDQIADEYAGKAKIGTVDVDTNRDTAVRYSIANIPTVIVFKGGEVHKKFVGLTSKDELARAINEAAGA